MRETSEFDAFYAGTSRRVLGSVYAMTGSVAEAEDAVAEAYARAWQRWPRVRACDSPEAWVRTVASRLAVSSWRKSVNRWRAHAASRPVQEELPGLDPSHVALVDALRRLPEKQRRAVVLHHLVGLPVTEVAAEMGSPDGTVKAWLARGRTALAAHLADDDEPTPTASARAKELPHAR
ncbi:sigma-70 family RNA polymerase sigma factor [Motilibacter aurantiacus]|uniref:sigma-70 family RNA polymerase sigma factor n=1 Tax=Motilibacter aurantiacus TaxID=2714955 RepID=UPI00140C4A83|nr:sigma-70 family RNA polymerase sigma factor [Motilibacter aurantiacus]NHC45331.1 sigma-70 family RNA polymerase sigma factor [Motilibacter aurantiacus]